MPGAAYTPQFTGDCRALDEAARRARYALEAYRLYAEARYGIDPGFERLSAQMAGEGDDPCLAVWRLSRAVNRGVCILGPGPLGDVRGCPALAGPEPAIHHALETGRRLAYLTTDLDSSLRLLGMAEYAAVYKLVHVHSDNHYRLHLARGWSGVVYTGQVEAPGVFPLGGFTDGDRAVVAAMVLAAPWIKVLGYTRRQTGWYKDWGWGKPGKLEVAARIIAHVSGKLGYTLHPLPGGLLIKVH